MEKIFKDLARDLFSKNQAGLVRLAVDRGGQIVFDRSEPRQFCEITDWLLDRIPEHGNEGVLLERILGQCKALDRFIYPFPYSWIGTWEIGNGLVGHLVLGLKYMPASPAAFSGQLKEFLDSYSGRFCERPIIGASAGVPFHPLVGESTLMRELKKRMLQVARVDYSLLIEGESGTGKELVARGVHLLGRRAANPFVAVNAAAIPENLMESELFGCRKGAFTGATESRIGLIEAANRGTLFLDEIADLPIILQAKLLRVLQEREIRRLGENHGIPVDIRIISATNGNIKSLAVAGKFREDLYYRLQDLQLLVPPLRERREDIPDLVRHFLRLYGGINAERSERRWGGWLSDFLLDRDFPGNVRELEAEVKRFLTFGQVDGQFAGEPDRNCTLRAARDRFERGYIISRLRGYEWNRHRTAAELGISRMTLFNLMKKHRIAQSDSEFELSRFFCDSNPVIQAEQQIRDTPDRELDRARESDY